MLEENIDITNLSNFRTKASTKYFFEISSKEDIIKLKEVLEFSKKENLKVEFIGGGTNILFAFDKFDGIIIKNNIKGWTYLEETKELQANSGENISLIAVFLEKNHGNSIWHRFIGLPGTVGGAVFGNAGCFGLEIENNFVSANVYDLETYEVKELTSKEIQFSYRDSTFKQSLKYFIISAKFDLSEIREKYSSDVDVLLYRKTKQPKGNSCGSFFKNPSKEMPAGFLIEQVGLKGFEKGGVKFSELHSNFLINMQIGNDYRNLLEMINLAQDRVKKQFGVELIPEVKILKND